MRERILRAADRLFYGEGVRATGVDAVAAEAGISKRTLYNHFASKDALIAAYLERRARPLPPAEGPPADQILGLFESLERGFADPRFRGCPFVNAVAELGDGPSRDLAVAFKDGRRAWFRERLAALGARDPDALSGQLALLLDGAIAQALVRGDPTVARSARDAARVLLTAAGVAERENTGA